MPPRAEFVCVDVQTAQVMSGPSTWAYSLLEVPLHYPLAVLGQESDFYEVADHLGRKGWIKKEVVTSAPCVVVMRGEVNAREEPSTSHEVVFRAREGVGFKVLEFKAGWYRVLHESGREAWIHGDLVWGPR